MWPFKRRRNFDEVNHAIVVAVQTMMRYVDCPHCGQKMNRDPPETKSKDG